MAAAASFYFTELRFTFNSQYIDAQLLDLLKHTALVPYQYRVLVPELVKLIRAILSPLPIFVPWLDIYRMVDFAAVFLLIVAFRQYLSLFIRDTLLYTLLSFTLFLVLPYNYLLPRIIALWYPWDMPSLLFFTVGLILIYKQNWKLYYPLFAVAVLNRETICFLTVVYFFTAAGRTPWRTVLFHVCLQLVLWTIIKFALYLAFIDNPWKVGRLFAFRPLMQLQSLLDVRFLPTLLGGWGYIWVLVLCGYRYIDNVFVKRSLLAAIPFMLGMFCVADVLEMRVYGELTPVLLSAAVLGLKGMFKEEGGATPSPVPR